MGLKMNLPGLVYLLSLESETKYFIAYLVNRGFLNDQCGVGVKVLAHTVSAL